jgi:ABC-type Fe3+/spermidine/putrescine transport system ATPase subunit
MSHRVAVMESGEILQLDTPETVYRNPGCRAVADFFGGCTYLRGSVKAGVFRCAGVELSVAEPDGEYDLLLRPHNFCPEESGAYPVMVESLRFRGEDTLVAFRGEDGSLWQYPAAHNPPWKPGDRVMAVLRTENPVLFPGE